MFKPKSGRRYAMKWREPWTPTLRRQGPFRFFSRHQRRSVAGWALTFTAIFCIVWIRTGELAVDRLWVIPVASIAIATLLGLLLWLAPITVSSGPAGIVRSKGQSHALIRWQSITSFRFVPHAEEIALELELDGKADPERLYLPLTADLDAIGEEIRRETGR